MKVRKSMKSFKFFLLLCLVISSVGLSATSEALAKAPIKVLVDEEEIAFDQPPVIKDGRTLVPLRGVFEEFGAYVQWDSATQSVTSNRNGKIVKLKIGSKSATVNKQTITIDVPAQIINGRTMVPLRFVSEAYGAYVVWNSNQQAVEISTFKMVSDRFFKHSLAGERLKEMTEAEFEAFMYEMDTQHELVNVTVFKNLLDGYYELLTYHVKLSADEAQTVEMVTYSEFAENAQKVSGEYTIFYSSNLDGELVDTKEGSFTNKSFQLITSIFNYSIKQAEME